MPSNDHQVTAKACKNKRPSEIRGGGGGLQRGEGQGKSHPREAGKALCKGDFLKQEILGQVSQGTPGSGWRAGGCKLRGSRGKGLESVGWAVAEVSSPLS